MFAAPRNGKAVVLHKTLLHYLILPVGSFVIVFSYKIQTCVQFSIFSERCSIIGITFQYQVGKLCGVCHGQCAPCFLKAGISIKRKFCGPPFAFFGGYNHYTIGAPGTVYGSCRCIFQYINAFNILRRYEADISGLITINNVYRIAAIDRTDATDAYA